MQGLDTERIRAEFPIFEHFARQGTPFYYFDNAATTQKPLAVIKTLHDYYSFQNANIHRGIYPLAAEATQAYEAARQKVQQFFNARESAELIFTSGTTEGVNLIANSFLAPRLNTGDRVLISAFEHHSDLIPWQMICKARGAHLQVIPMTEAGELDLSAFAKMLTTEVKMLAISHISNSLGTINPIGEMIELAHQNNIPVLVDVAQSAAHYPIDVQAWDCDFLVCSGHKLFGPTGIGALFAKAEYLEVMQPYQFGGEMIRTVTFEETTFAKVPHKFEAGTPHIAGAIGLGSAIDFINTLDRKAVIQHLENLRDYATAKLSAINGVHIIGQASAKTAILSFTLEGVHPHDMATFLAAEGIAVRAGHHCTQPVMDFYGLPGTTRASFSIYNTLDEIDALAKAVEEVRAFFG